MTTDEQEKTENKEEQTQREKTEESSSLVDNATLAAERLEKANEKREELIARDEALHAKKILGGRSEAGAVKEKPKEETPEEYTERFESGEIDLTKP